MKDDVTCLFFHFKWTFQNFIEFFLLFLEFLKFFFRNFEKRTQLALHLKSFEGIGE